MNKVTVTGVIRHISEVKELNNGAATLEYWLELDQYTTIPVEMYKKPEYRSHIDNFIKYNEIGKTITVELTIGGRIHEGRCFGKFSHWKEVKDEAF